MESAFADYYKGRMPFWNYEYRECMFDICECQEWFTYHYIAKINWSRELKKETIIMNNSI